ncbi:BolA-like protein 3 [Pseudolycoriella hygida]|uniref:BolA-like protein 3 n=1 Tax=Pseudolycoriella hygida TaxID=35572 RepID=A0A9Q0MU38_9DIPT|nr:BolA-like protein 3 [Pseudolycoriella hygida]
MLKLKNLVAYNQYRNISLLSRMWSGANGNPKYTEKDLEAALKSKFVKAKNIQVSDVSGGCGAMYEIIVESSEFQGISRVKQHQMITDTLKEEIKDMHGLRIHTAVPK